MFYSLMLMNFFLSINFIQMTHPLSMGLMLLMQTILISLICGYISINYWFAYILFLVMIGGMLVLFIYMTSLASNELFNFSMNSFMILMFLFIMSLMMFYFLDPFSWLYQNYEMIQFNSMEMSMNLENQFNLMKLYNNPSMNITMMLINYLLLTLIIVVKISNKNHGPLRSKFN
uniref:NADH-ubiquinone oxidoreductase chain 6 n=1 Tax=Osmylus fulvicephalus TaxID=446453 RepID=A0A7G7WS74_9NEOP|nr:NADH dehydrogenase subunit 6 [Osmylus fulvicephalus]QNH69900.1 NADH dehydrogenase subunit 6 [Osmylus fulvicephalus]